MAYTTAQLVTAYTNANLGKAPDAATTLTLDAYATQTLPGGALTDAQALANTLKLVNSTTAVAIEAYQFFTNRAPSAAGLTFLVNSATNNTDLNDAYYSKFGQENRFINFSINLATGQGEGAAAFASSYGSVSYAQTVATAYDKIIGNDAAKAAGIDPAAAVAYLTRADNISYLTAFVKANTSYTSASDIDLAVKAALIGEVLNAATVSGIGIYAGATAAMVADLSDGVLSTDSANGVNILTAYPQSIAGKSFSLTTAADTLVGTNGNDTFTALTVGADGKNASTLTAFDSIDGGAGTDTLNIYTDNGNTLNNATFSTLSVKNVEVINILNQNGAVSALADGSLYAGAQQIWQVGAATNIGKLDTGMVAGFRSITGGTFTVGVNDGISNVQIATDKVTEGALTFVAGTVNSATSTINTLTITGNVNDTNADGSVDAEFATLNVGKNVATAIVNSAVNLNLTVNANNSGPTNAIATLDASGSTGGITYTGGTSVTKVTTGTGSDTVTFNASSNSATTVSTVSTGAGDDVITVGTSGSAAVSILSGDGKDSVTLNSTSSGATTVDLSTGNDTLTLTNHGSGKLTASLGDGDDTFVVTNAAAVLRDPTANSGAGPVDSIDGGNGTDTIQFSVGVGQTLSSDNLFSKVVTGFEKVSITALTNVDNGTINLGNLNNIGYVVSAGSDTKAGVTEFVDVTFSSLAGGQSVTVGGVTYTNNTGATLSASQVAANFSSSIDVNGWTDTNQGGGVVRFTSTTANTNVTDLAAGSASLAPAATAPTISTTTQGVTPVPGTTETGTVTFTGLIAGESTTVAGRTVTATAVTENAQLTFIGSLSNTYTVNVGGRVATVGVGGATGAEVAQALATGSNVGNVTISGSLNPNFTLSNTGSVLTATATVSGANVTDITYGDSGAGGYTAVYTQGTNGNLSATQVASVFGGSTVNGANVTGALSGWTAGAASGQSVTFTSTTANANVTDLSGSVSTTSGSAQTVTKVDGVAAVAGVTEAGSITFGALKDGQSVTVAGVTYTNGTGTDLSASAVANNWANAAGASITQGGNTFTLTNSDITDAVVTFTGPANLNVADLTGASVGQPTAPTAPSYAITQGSASTGNLTLTNFVNGGTLELTGVTAGNTSVVLKDASGTSDVVNIRLNGASNIVNTGTITVAGVETINITATDSNTKADPAAASVPNLVATSATSVVVTGNHGVNFTGSTLSALTSLDTTGVVATLGTATQNAAWARVTVGAGAYATDKALTVLTGMGNDVINLGNNTKGATINAGNGANTVTGTQGADTIVTGSGADVVNQTTGADTITLGAGNDKFVLTSAGASTLTTTQTLTDFSANTYVSTVAGEVKFGAYASGTQAGATGDVIDVSALLVRNAGATAGITGSASGIAVGVFNSAADAQTFIQTTFQNTANTGFALDSSTGKLYLDFNHDGNVDSVINLTGVTTLTTGAFLTGFSFPSQS